MTYRVILQPSAAAELEEAFLWIFKRNPDAGLKWFSGIEQAIATLANFPERLPLAAETDAFDEDIRQLLYGKRGGRYRILFTIQMDTVHVLHIRHGARERLKPDSK